MSRIPESALVLPTLHILYSKERVHTAQLIKLLRELLNPLGEDLEILAGRNDDKFSQKVRNLKSHRTLQKLGLAEIVKENGKEFFSINNKGKELYLNKKDDLKSLWSFSFNTTQNVLSDILKPDREVSVLSDIIENPFVLEGEVTQTVQKKIKRSKSLRDAAIEHYSENGRIKCKACFFEFKKVYGDIGKNYIEIHHIKAICTYGKNLELQLDSAIQNVIPLCANCHRVVHLYRPALKVEKIKKALKSQT